MVEHVQEVVDVGQQDLLTRGIIEAAPEKEVNALLVEVSILDVLEDQTLE